MCYLESRVHRVSARLTMLAVLAAGWLVTTVAGAATYVIPHWIEHSGSTAGSTYVFDDFIYLRYTPGLVGTSTGPGAIVDLYL
jgi:hypothetical protein